MALASCGSNIITLEQYLQGVPPKIGPPLPRFLITLIFEAFFELFFLWIISRFPERDPQTFF